MGQTLGRPERFSEFLDRRSATDSMRSSTSQSLQDFLRRHQVGLDSQGLLVGCLSFNAPAQFLQRPAAEVVCLGAARVDPKHRAEVDERILISLLIQMQRAQEQVGIRPIRIEADGLLVLLSGT